MSHCILLADDSQTIHKVMTYTFMNGPFRLDIASTGNEVKQKLNKNTYDIILLDFGLSESVSGYELAKEISAQAVHSSIVMLFGSLDTIDENQLKAAGVQERITKPFDSQQLVEICQTIIQAKGSPPIAEESPTPLASDDQNWQMRKPALPDSPPSDARVLEKELQDWSVDVPPVIEESAAQNITAHFKMPEEIAANRGKIPLDKDLEYPKQKTKEPTLPSVEEILQQEGPEKIKRRSLSELNTEPGLEEFDLDQISLTTQIDEDKPEKIPPTISINKEELGKISSTSEMDHDQSDKINNYEVSSEHFWNLAEEDKPEDQDLDPASVEFSRNHSKVDLDDIMEKLRPIIEQNIQQCCKETIEKVAWEIIPDLAENIIKKEIQEIKDSVIK